MKIDKSRLDKGLYWQRAWKLVEGCTKCSPGCYNCWSETETAMRANHPNEKISDRAHNVLAGMLAKEFSGEVTLRQDNLDLPLRTRRPTVFAVWNDLFHTDVPEAFIGKVYDVMHECQDHAFLILTKRAERMAEIAPKYHLVTMPNIYHGVTVCNQTEAEANIPHLLSVPGKRFLSIEPMLGPIDLFKTMVAGDKYHCEWCGGFSGDGNHDCYDPQSGIHQILLGGESGSRARPMHPDWVNDIERQCREGSVPFYFKQWGEWAPGVTGDIPTVSPEKSKLIGEDSRVVIRVGKKKAGRSLYGQLHDELIWCL